jgi:hypothetical protein
MWHFAYTQASIQFPIVICTAYYFYLLKKINPSRNHEFHNRESTEWSGKSQIPQLPIHPMDWKSQKVPRNANAVNPME